MMMNNNEAEFNVVMFPPNKQMEPRAAFSISPKVYDALMFFDFNTKGKKLLLTTSVLFMLHLPFLFGLDNCIIGSSDVSGTFWEGALLYFNDLKFVHNFDYASCYIGSTASDGKFLNDNTVQIN